MVAEELMLLRLYTSDRHWIVALTLSRISGILSIFGSCAILYIILSDRKKKLQQRHNRLLIGACFYDVLFSSAMVVSTAAVPRDTSSSNRIYGAIGNATTCKIQGFLLQMAPGFMMYLASLSIHHLLTVKYELDDVFISTRIEPWMHAISNVIPITTAIILVCLDMFHPKYTICWIATKPWGCVKHPNTCEAAANAPYFEFAFGHLWFIITIVIQVVSMTLIYYTVRQRERIMDSFSFREKTDPVLVSNKSQLSIQCRDTAIQALLTISTTVTLAFPLIGDIVVNSGTHVTLPFLICEHFCSPLLGFINFITYIRPKYMEVSRNYPQQSFWRNVKSVFLNEYLNRRRSIDDCQLKNMDDLECHNTTHHTIVNTTNPTIIPAEEINLQLEWSQLDKVTYHASGSHCWTYSAVYNHRPVIVKLLKVEYQNCLSAMNEMEDELGM